MECGLAGRQMARSPYEEEKHRRDEEKRRKRDNEREDEDRRKKTQQDYAQRVLENTGQIVDLLKQSKEDLNEDGYYFSSNISILELQTAKPSALSKDEQRYISVDNLISIESKRGHQWLTHTNRIVSVLIFGSRHKVVYRDEYLGAGAGRRVYNFTSSAADEKGGIYALGFSDVDPGSTTTLTNSPQEAVSYMLRVVVDDHQRLRGAAQSDVKGDGGSSHASFPILRRARRLLNLVLVLGILGIVVLLSLLN